MGKPSARIAYSIDTSVQKWLTGMGRIVYQVKYSHKSSYFIGLQNEKDHEVYS